MTHEVKCLFKDIIPPEPAEIKKEDDLVSKQPAAPVIKNNMNHDENEDLPRLFPKIYSSVVRQRRSRPRLPSRMFNTVCRFVEYPNGVYIDKYGEPQPDVKVKVPQCSRVKILKKRERDLLPTEEREEQSDLLYDKMIKFENDERKNSTKKRKIDDDDYDDDEDNDEDDEDEDEYDDDDDEEEEEEEEEEVEDDDDDDIVDFDTLTEDDEEDASEEEEEEEDGDYTEPLILKKKIILPMPAL